MQIDYIRLFSLNETHSDWLEKSRSTDKEKNERMHGGRSSINSTRQYLGDITITTPSAIHSEDPYQWNGSIFANFDDSEDLSLKPQSGIPLENERPTENETDVQSKKQVELTPLEERILDSIPF